MRLSTGPSTSQENPPGAYAIPRSASQPPRKRRRRGGLIGSNVSSAIEALWTNRLRSLLTMLGIVIGVGAVIAAITLTEGISELLNENLSGLGTNVLTIIPSMNSSSLTADDASAIAKLPHIVYASPILQVSGKAIFGEQNDSPQIEGVNPDFQNIGNWHLAEGSWFSSQDEQSGAQVAVIGKSVADELFKPAGTDPIGQTLRLNGQIFRVVGVLQAKGAQGVASQDDVVFVPFTTASMRLKSSTHVDQIQAQVDSADNVSQAQQNITLLLEQRHHLPAGGSVTNGTTSNGGPPSSSGSTTDDFQILNASQLLQAAQQQGQAQATLLIGIAAISLTVGGIGVMNIMLVSVTERTREIGIRMAVGAKRRHIRNQFLMEALTLCSLGGGLGILAGLLGGFVLVKTSTQPLPFVVSLPFILLAIGVSATVGLVFGLYPAHRASRLDPIVALHKE
jgi:putative ABC transport system permease protein